MLRFSLICIGSAVALAASSYAWGQRPAPSDVPKGGVFDLDAAHEALQKVTYDDCRQGDAKGGEAKLLVKFSGKDGKVIEADFIEDPPVPFASDVQSCIVRRFSKVQIATFGGDSVKTIIWPIKVGVATPLAACAKDTDCKGDRICDKGTCVSPTPSPVATPAPSASASPEAEPSVVKKKKHKSHASEDADDADSGHKARTSEDSPNADSDATSPRLKARGSDDSDDANRADSDTAPTVPRKKHRETPLAGASLHINPSGLLAWGLMPTLEAGSTNVTVSARLLLMNTGILPYLVVGPTSFDGDYNPKFDFGWGALTELRIYGGLRGHQAGWFGGPWLGFVHVEVSNDYKSSVWEGVAFFGSVGYRWISGRAPIDCWFAAGEIFKTANTDTEKESGVKSPGGGGDEFYASFEFSVGFFL